MRTIRHRHALRAAPLAASLCMIAALAGAAEARIVCEGSFQVQKDGTRINTPWCADNLLAKVAREAGMRVSNAAVRNNPSIKAEACRIVGYDIRVRDACAGFRNENRGGIRF